MYPDVLVSDVSDLSQVGGWELEVGSWELIWWLRCRIWEPPFDDRMTAGN